MPEKPAFDPNKPFSEPVIKDTTKPAFNPNKGFMPIENKQPNTQQAYLDAFQGKNQVKKDEKIAKVWGDKKEETSFGGELFNSLARGSARLGEALANTPSMIYDIAAMPFNYVASGQFQEDLQPLPNMTESMRQENAKNPMFTSEKFAKSIGLGENKVAKYYNEDVKARQQQTAQKYDKGITDYFSNGEYKKGFGLIANSVAESAPVTISLLMGNAAGVSTTGSILGGGTVFAADKKAELDKEAPNLDQQTKMNIALSNGLFEGLFEQFGITKLGGLTKDVLLKSGKEEAKKIAAEGFKDVYTPVLKKYVGVSAEESISEAATQFAQNAVDKYSGYKPDLDLKEGVVDAAIVGLAAGATTSAPTSLLEVAKNKSANKEAVNIQKANIEKENERSRHAFEVSKGGDEAVNEFVSGVEADVADGNLTREQGDNAIVKIKSYSDYHKQTQDLNLDDEDKRKVFDYTFQKTNLIDQLKAVDKDKLNGIELAKYHGLEKQAKDLQGNIDELILKAQLQDETTISDTTIDKQAKNEQKPSKEEKKPKLTEAQQAIKDRYKKQPEPEVGKYDDVKYEDIPLADFNSEKFNARVKHAKLADYLETIPDKKLAGKLVEKKYTYNNKQNSTYAVQLPDGKVIKLASSMERPEKFRGHMRTEHLIDAKDLVGFPVGVKVEYLPEGKKVIKLYNGKTGKFISWAKETNRGLAKPSELQVEQLSHLETVKEPPISGDVTPIEETTPPVKPITDLTVQRSITSEDVRNEAKQAKTNLQDQEKKFFGEQGARRYKAAQNVIKSRLSTTKQINDAQKVVDDMEASLSKEQQDEFFGRTSDVKSPEYLEELANRLSVIEEAENVADLADAANKPLMDYTANPNDEMANVLLKAIADKSQELGISGNELIKAITENISAKLADVEDIELIINNVFKALTNENAKESTVNRTESAKGDNNQVIPKVSNKVKTLVRGTKKANRKIKHKGMLKALKTEVFTPHELVMQYFIGGGELNPESVRKLFKGSKGEMSARISYLRKNGNTIEQIAEKIVNDNESLNLDMQDVVNAVEDVVNGYNSSSAMASAINSANDIGGQELNEFEAEMEQGSELADEMGIGDEINNAIDIIEGLTDEQILAITENQQALDDLIDENINDIIGDDGEGDQFQKSKDDKNLLVMHNISAEKLRNSDKLGGLPVPSLAITRTDIPFEGFGDISLIGDVNLADPKSYKNKVFAADIYSPRYPSVEKRIADYSQSKKLASELADASEKYGIKNAHANIDIESALGGDLNRYVKAAYLQENDIKLKPKKGDDLSDAIREYFYKNENVEKINKWFENKLSDYKIDERIFDGFTNSGNRKYLPHNLDTVVKILTRKLQGGENFNYGAGSLRAMVAPKFKSVSDIKKSADKIVTAEEFDKIKDEVNNELLSLGDSLKDNYKYDSNKFGYYDTFTEILSDYASGNRSELTDSFENLTEKDFKSINDFLLKLKNLPTSYFEAKPQRSVDINEFKAAVIPKDSPSYVKDILNKKGVSIYEYDKNKTGSRQKAIEEANKAQDLAFQKQKGGKGNVEAEHHEKVLKVISAMQKALPNIEFKYNKKLKAAGVLRASGKTIEINPYYAGLDTPIHEAGHVLIDAMGYDNQVIQAAFKQLKNTKLADETKQRYPELSEEMLNKEILAEAIGREGAGIFDTEAEKSRFKQLLDYIFTWFKNKLGLNKNVAKSLAKQIIGGIGTKDIGGTQSKTDQEQADFDKKQIKQGKDIETGKPVTINFIKNLEPIHNMGSRFGQDVEPTGSYISQRESKYLTKGWAKGTVTLNNPLVIPVSIDTLVEWKRDLAKKYGKKGKALTAQLQKEGYDGIITKNTEGSFNGMTGEIIVFDRNKVDISDVQQFQKPKSEDDFNKFREKQLGRNIKDENKDLEQLDKDISEAADEDTKEELEDIKQSILDQQEADKEAYEKYLDGKKSIAKIADAKTLKDFTLDELVENYNTIRDTESYGGDETLTIAKERIARFLEQSQIEFLEKAQPKLFDKAQVNKKDLSPLNVWVKALADISEKFPAVQALSKEFNDKVLEMVQERSKLKAKHEKLGKAVIREYNKKRGIKGIAESLFSSNSARYFEYLDKNGRYLTDAEAKKANLSKAQIDYLNFMKELNKMRGQIYDENDNLIQDAVIKTDKGFLEKFGEKDGGLAAVSYALGGGNNLDVEVQYTNPNTGKKETDTYQNAQKAIIEHAYKKGGNKAMALGSLLKLAYKAKKEQKVNQSINYRGELTSKFDEPYEGDSYSKDFYAAGMRLIDDVTHVQNMNKLIPLFDSVQYLYDKGLDARLPNIAKFVEDELQSKIYQRETQTDPILDYTLKFFRNLSSKTTMAFNVAANAMNVFIGNYNAWRESGLPHWLKGNKRLFGKDGLNMYAIDLLKKYDVVNTDYDSNPKIGSGLFDKIAYAGGRWGEIQIQGSDFLGRLTPEEFDSFEYNKDGELVVKKGKDEKALLRKMNEYKNEVASIQGKYDERDRRKFMRGEIGKNIAQYKTWIPDFWRMRFGEETIDKYGNVHRGSWNMFTDVAMQEIKDDFSKENNYGITMKNGIPTIKNKQIAANLRGAMTVATFLIAMNAGDDEDKKNKQFEQLSLDNTLGNLLFIFDPNNAEYLVSHPVAIQGTISNFLKALDGAIKGDNKKFTKYGTKLLPYRKLKSDIELLTGEDKK